jgi:hypothetical protein
MRPACRGPASPGARAPALLFLPAQSACNCTESNRTGNNRVVAPPGATITSGIQSWKGHVPSPPRPAALTGRDTARARAGSGRGRPGRPEGKQARRDQDLQGHLERCRARADPGADQGRDFETFRTYLAGSLRFSRGFIGLASPDTVVFACTIQREDVRGKIKDDLTSICTQGTTVQTVYFLCTEPVKVSVRHDLQAWATKKFGVALEVLDGPAIARLLAEHETFWIARTYLHLPAELFPALPPARRQPRTTLRRPPTRRASSSYHRRNPRTRTPSHARAPGHPSCDPRCPGRLRQCPPYRRTRIPLCKINAWRKQPYDLAACASSRLPSPSNH